MGTSRKSAGRSSHTRSGTRRLGDEYQDAFALDLAVEMLEHPDRYEWMRLEADGFGSLDDIVAKRAGSGLELTQVKFSVHPDSPEDPWTWDDLLASPKKNVRPLLKKWFDSLRVASQRGSLDDARVVTNRRASPEVARALDDSSRIRIDRIEDSQLRGRVSGMVGTDVDLSMIRFEFDQPGLDIRLEAARTRFRRLGGTDEGWASLREAFRRWGTRRDQPSPDGLIELQHIRAAGQWNRQEPLPQDFVVPDDYVLPSDAFHKDFKGRAVSGDHACVVLTASPGCGKSTYLSYLFQELKSDEMPVVRHHFFLSVDDRTVDRLDFFRVAESLIADLQTCCRDAPASAQVRNPRPDKLSSLLGHCGDRCQKQGKRLVIILDGLDHVWRENHSIDTLRRLFEHVLCKHPGVTVLIGTQPVADIQLPTSLIQFAPREDWIELPTLDDRGVTQWVEKNGAGLGLPGDQRSRELMLGRYASAFSEISDGHPLHLKYSLQALRESGYPTSEDRIRSLSPCSHGDITQYYRQLWAVLPENARNILHLLAEGEFPWPLDALPRCLDPCQSRHDEVMAGFQGVRHLLRETRLGWVAFHPSLLSFVLAHDDHRAYAKTAQEKILAWLRREAPDFWRWAYEWLVEDKLGDSQSLIQRVDRAWVAEAIAKRRPWQQVKTIMTRAVWRALDEGRIAVFVRHALLLGYARNAHEYLDYIYEKLLLPQLKIAEDPYLSRRLTEEMRSLSDVELGALAQYGHDAGQKDIVKRCLEEIQLWCSGDRDRGYASGISDWPEGVQPFLWTVALLDAKELRLERLLAIVQGFDAHSRRSAFGLFTRALRANRQLSTLRALFPLAPEDLQPVVARDLVLLAIEEGASLSRELSALEQCVPEMAAVFVVCRGAALGRTSRVGRTDLSIFQARNVMTRRLRPAYAETFVSFFWSTVQGALAGNEDATSGDTRTQLLPGWTRGYLDMLAGTAYAFAETLRNRQSLPYSWLFASARDFEKPCGQDTILLSDQVAAARRALELLSSDCFVVSMALSPGIQIVDEDIEELERCPILDQWIWLDGYVENGRPYLCLEVFHRLVYRLGQDARSSIAYCCTRAENLASLATLTAFEGDHDCTIALLRDAAQDLLGYGWRKDFLLHNVLEVIEACAENNCGAPESWIRRVAPAIASINDITDGDETDHFPVKLATVLPHIRADLVSTYYLWLARNEDYQYALDAFEVVLTQLDLSSPLDRAIACTAIDNAGLHHLDERVRDGDAHASSVTDSIAELFGETSMASSDSGEASRENQVKESVSPQLPEPGQYPPAQFSEYLAAIRDLKGGYSGSGVVPWLEFWKDAERGEDAFVAVEQADDRGEGIGSYWPVYEMARDLRGRRAAYPWLIKAAAFDHLWDGNWGRDDEAQRCWDIVRSDYAHEWSDFLAKSLQACNQGARRELHVSWQISRIVEYLLHLGKSPEAVAVAEAVVDFAVESVSTLPLPVPGWLEE